MGLSSLSTLALMTPKYYCCCVSDTGTYHPVEIHIVEEFLLLFHVPRMIQKGTFLGYLSSGAFRTTKLLSALAPEHQLEFIPVIFKRSILGPNGGFVGEERLVKIDVAKIYLEKGFVVEPSEEARKGIWCFNPETNEEDRYIERTESFLEFSARKRQWLDLYWRVNTGYLLFSRQAFGGGWRINCPLRKKDVCQKLWQQYRVRVEPGLVEFRNQDRLAGIDQLGHNWCWLYMPGAEELHIDREVYDNKRVKVRIHIRRPVSGSALY